jgi:hypothetical protein
MKLSSVRAFLHRLGNIYGDARNTVEIGFYEYRLRLRRVADINSAS